VKVRLRQASWIAALLSTTLWAVDPPSPTGQMVDSGTFVIYQGGKRVGTEKFSIQQSAEGSQISTELTMEAAAGGDHQSSLLEISTTGDIRRYEFKTLGAQKVDSILAPKDDFLVQTITTGDGDKPIEQKYILPASTNVLDDFVFVQREVLVWRYLATSCQNTRAGLKCPQKQKTPMAVVVPHGRTSLQVGLEFAGREKAEVRGQVRDLNRVDLTGDSSDWQLWVDDDLKLVRMTIPAEGTEIVRE
jgi:hypothetical protein